MHWLPMTILLVSLAALARFAWLSMKTSLKR